MCIERLAVVGRVEPFTKLNGVWKALPIQVGFKTTKEIQVEESQKVFDIGNFAITVDVAGKPLILQKLIQKIASGFWGC